MDKDTFNHDLLTYLWVLALAAFGSVVSYLNKMQEFVLGRLIIECLNGGFTGLLTYWLCVWQGVTGPLMAFCIGVSGLMGARIWNEMLLQYKLRLGLTTTTINEEGTTNEKTAS